MIIPDLEGLARDFWAGTGWQHTFPRPIEQAAPLRLPLVVIKQPHTDVATVRNWLRQRGLIIQLVDYHLPRQQVLQALGAHVAAVLDGQRRPSPAERAAAILAHVRLGAHTHLLPRPGAKTDDDWAVAHVEDRADRLTLELVAPRVSVRDVLNALLDRQVSRSEDLRAALATHFGLPAYTFNATIQRLLRPPPRSFVEDMRVGLRNQT
jgi:hypothetical protein